MTDSHVLAVDEEKSGLLYLKNQQAHLSNVDVAVASSHLQGEFSIRRGQVISAVCGKLKGNGALLTLLTIGEGKLTEQPAAGTREHNVSLSLTIIEKLLAKLPPANFKHTTGDEENSLQQAVHSILQFDRARAGSILVDLLRKNRFYYPAWLWHSRLMTREDYVKKALTEARKWGNVDPIIQRETAKLEPQFTGSEATVKRCIFCWSIISAGVERCKTCQGILRIDDRQVFEPSKSSELIETVKLYEEEWQNHPNNTRIAYCLCLGHLSLGNRDKALEYISKATALSPKEPIFIKASALLNQTTTSNVKPTITVPPASAALSPAGQKKILVVEDSQTSRKVIGMLLERRGYAIVEAKSGAEAIQCAESILPNLVLLDVMLPDMSGYEVLARIRQSKNLADIPVVMLTGKTNPSDRLKGLYHGSNEYLTKPFDPAKLLAVLQKYLEQQTGAPAVTKTTLSKQSTITPKTFDNRSPVASAGDPTTKSRKQEEPEKPRTTQPAMKPAGTGKIAAPANTVKPTPQVSAAAQLGKTILVVEDSPTSRKVITMVLSKKGYTIEEAPTGGSALQKIETTSPNLILLDAMLPDMTGYDILSYMKKHSEWQNIPVVMLTAKNNPMDRQKGLKSGSVAYLTKPFDPGKLLTVIEEHIK